MKRENVEKKTNNEDAWDVIDKCIKCMGGRIGEVLARETFQDSEFRKEIISIVYPDNKRRNREIDLPIEVKGVINGYRTGSEKINVSYRYRTRWTMRLYAINTRVRRTG